VNDAVGSHGDVDLYTLGLVYRFGGPEAPAKTAAYIPYVAPIEPMATTPAPAPEPTLPPATQPVLRPQATPIAPQQAPEPAAWAKVKIEADTLFGFDQDQLQADGKNALDSLLLALQRVDIDEIQVIGHTDRLGSQAYNDKLSKRRAEAVKSYLVQTGGLSTSKISTSGLGAQQPQTLAKDCPGTQATRTLITCLRTDRRVEVEVSGQEQKP
jgi:OOP family OmpA-OmpF porin